MGAVLERESRANDAGSERQLVQRVAAGELFQRSPRLRELLLYVGECTLDNRVSDVREQVIAERVFGRKPENGGQDSIVRAEARNLRKRLELYFETEGREEAIVISMPKGGYSLAFHRRSLETAIALNVPELEPVVPERDLQPASPVAPTDDPTLLQLRKLRRLTVASALVAILSLVLAFYWFDKQRHLARYLDADGSMLPFSGIFSDDHESLIVTSDVGLLQISWLLHRRITLDEYIARNYPLVGQTNPPDLLKNWNIYEFTDGRETSVAGLILHHNAQFAPTIAIRSGHAVQLQDFKDHNVILIGSPLSNPWAQLYEDQLNFRCDLAPDERIVFRNKSVRKAEQRQYPNDEDMQRHRTYARIAFLPKTSGAGATLLIAGTTAQSTQAAGEFVADEAAFSRVLRSAGIDPLGPPHFFEILVSSSNFVGGAISTDVVAYRLASTPDK